ncbi:MAG TPA: hypothetical protein VK427_10535 [Kofleriaceae bacterium]|nr:hypothetical protein [Kofleriaceae bacterium]
MARLGELLVAAGTLTAHQIEQALRAQVLWGGRLGTNLVELGYVDLDTLATMLGKQHRMPAALARHFDKCDPAVQAKLSPDIAERFSCVPLLYAGPQCAQLIVATLAPLDRRAIGIIADALELEPGAIIQSIAGELRIRYHLERAYKIPRTTRFLRSRGKTMPPFPQFEIDPLAFEDSQVDAPIPDLAEAEIDEVRGELRARLESKAARKQRAPTQPPAELDEEELHAIEMLAMIDEPGGGIDDIELETPRRDRRRYLTMIDAQVEPDPERSLGRIAIKRVTLPAAVDEPPVGGMTLGEATRAIRRSTDRDHVAELACETLFRFMLSCDAAQLLVIRGSAAISWKGFSRTGATLPEIAVPLDQPGLVPRAIERCTTTRSHAGGLGPIDQLLLISLGQQTGDLVIVPVSISSRVMCVIAMATQPEASSATGESVAAAAGAAFARLMRNASR